MDKVQKIRKEVEKLKSQLLRGACSSQITMETRCKEEAYNEVLAILDTMQEEPKQCMYSKDNYTDEDRKVLCDGCEEECKYAQKEEPVSEDLEKENKIKILADIIFNAAKYGYMPYDTQDEYCAMEIAKENIDKFIVPKKQEEPISEDLEKMSYHSAMDLINNPKFLPTTTFGELIPMLQKLYKDGAKWQKENLWKPADGDDLPEIDREVVALLDNGKVVFAHRPPEYWDGKNIITGKVTRNYPKTYDKGGWNIPDVKFWLDCLMPKEIEL